MRAYAETIAFVRKFAQNDPMHPVANEVQVPTEGVEDALRPFVLRRFTGRVRVPLRVKPEAALCVEVLDPEAIETTRLNEKKNIAPDDVFDSANARAREMVAHQFLREHAHRFRLRMNLTHVVCDLKDGRLNSAQWITVG
jgi:hypothetical protein